MPVSPHARAATGSNEDKTWNKYESAGATLSRNHAKKKASFDAKEQEARKEEEAAQAKLKRSQSKEAAAQTWTVSPKIFVEVSDHALHNGIEECQNRTKKLGTGTAAVMSRSAIEKLLVAFDGQHGPELLAKLGPELSEEFNTVRNKIKEVYDALLKAGAGEHKMNLLINKTLMPELVDMFKSFLDKKEPIVISQIPNASPEKQISYLKSVLPKATTPVMVEYVIKIGKLATDIDSDTVRHYSESVKMMVSADEFQSIKPIMDKHLLNTTKAAAVGKGLCITMLKVTNFKKFATEYVPKVQGTIDPFGGKVKFKKPTKAGTPLGDPCEVERTTAELYDIAVMLEFPDVEKALEWYKSKAYQQILKVRNECSAGPLCIMEASPKDYKAAALLFVKITNPAKFAGEYLPGFARSLTQNGKELGFLVAKAPMVDHPKLGKAAPYVEKAEDFTTCVIVGFNNWDDYHTWHTSDVYKPLIPVRYDSTEGPYCAAATLF